MSDGWSTLNAAVDAARQAVAAAAPDAATASEGEAYVARVAAASLADPLLGHLLRDGGLNSALPVRGGPNPDYRMQHATVDPQGRYRLEGRLNHSERVAIGLYALGKRGAMREQGYAVYDRGNSGADGGFTLDLAAGLAGAGTLAVLPDTRVLLIRTLHRDPLGPPARLTLTGGAAVPGLPYAAGMADAMLTRAANVVATSIAQYLAWTRFVAAHPNRLESAPDDLAQAVQGDPDTQYFLGSYQLGAGEWLELSLPRGQGGYWSLHAYNYWFEGLQVDGVHDRNAVASADGRVAIGIGPEVPDGLPNRIDTAGRSRGALILRIIGAAPMAAPAARIAGGAPAR